MKFFIVFFLVFSLSTSIAISQESPDQILEDFFLFYGEGNVNGAIDFVFSTNTYLGVAQQQIEAIKEKLNTVASVIGDYYKYEKVIQKEIGNSFVFLKCMVLHDRQPLFFTFVFYKPNDKWQLQTLRFDDKLEEDEMIDFKNSIQ